MPNRLYRSRTDRWLGGVCGGIAEHFNIDPTIVRLAFVLLILLVGTGIIAYLIGWIVIPLKPLVDRNYSSQSYPPPPP